jgi:hypothetical protein
MPIWVVPRSGLSTMLTVPRSGTFSGQSTLCPTDLALRAVVEHPSVGIGWYSRGLVVLERRAREEREIVTWVLDQCPLAVMTEGWHGVEQQTRTIESTFHTPIHHSFARLLTEERNLTTRILPRDHKEHGQLKRW